MNETPDRIALNYLSDFLAVFLADFLTAFLTAFLAGFAAVEAAFGVAPRLAKKFAIRDFLRLARPFGMTPRETARSYLEITVFANSTALAGSSLSKTSFLDNVLSSESTV